MTRRLTLAAAAVGLLLTMTASPARAAEPIPAFTQSVVDAAGVVDDGVEATVVAELADYQVRSGNQIAVAVVATTGDRSIEDYSIDVARTWGVGQKDKDSGVLLVIACQDRKLRIEVGRGLEGQLTDLQSGRIIRDRLVPLLKDGDVSAAVIQGTRAIRTELKDTQVGALPPAPGEGSGTTSPRGWLSIVAVIAFAVLAVVGRGRRGGRGRRDGTGNAIVWGAALAALGGFGGGRSSGGMGGGGGFGGGGASGDW